MKKRDLEIRLQSLDAFGDPDASLEQYPTPSVIATDVLFIAYSENDLDGKMNDLGCGTGIFAIGSSLLGADAAGFDISASAIEIAERNASSLDADVEFAVCDISAVTRKAETTIMNPPFGSQNRNADRPFLDKAFELSDVTYSMHMAKTLPFITKYAEDNGKEVCYHKTYKYNIPHTFSFHSKAEKAIDVVMVMIR